MSNVPMYGFGGGSGTGGVLTVLAPAGHTVTISKDGKTKTKTANDDGVAVFKGLSAGAWTYVITDGTQTSQPKTADVAYETTVTASYFLATIHITYPAGSVCTATDGTTTLTSPDTSGTWDCVVPNAGNWTVALDSGFSEVVSATENGGTYTVDKWYLFKDGDQYTHITGGYHNISIATFSDVIKLSPGNTGVTSYGTAVTNNKIPISGFKTMYFVMNRIIVPTVNGLYAMGLSPDNTTVDHNTYTAVVKKTGASNVSNVVLSLNISNASSNYVKVHVQDYNSSSYAEISKIYMMP